LGNIFSKSRKITGGNKFRVNNSVSIRYITPDDSHVTRTAVMIPVGMKNHIRTEVIRRTPLAHPLRVRETLPAISPSVTPNQLGYVLEIAIAIITNTPIAVTAVFLLYLCIAGNAAVETTV
jgi:hypothetical protein